MKSAKTTPPLLHSSTPPLLHSSTPPLLHSSTPPLYNYVHLIALANIRKGYELRTFAEKPTTSGGKRCPDNKATVPHAPLGSPTVRKVPERSEGGEVRTQAPHVRTKVLSCTLQTQFSPLGQTARELAKVSERSITKPLNRAAVKAPQTHSSNKAALRLCPLCPRRGFTLMEIMVVIVVIAVLASVAGPMVGSITDQGRASATLSKLSALKSALIAYHADVGVFPGGQKRNPKDGITYWQAGTLGWQEFRNCLVYRDVTEGIGGKYQGNYTYYVLTKKYKQRWRGPYMESDPEDFMFDAWGNIIRYVVQTGHKHIYLWSAGADGHFYGGYMTDGGRDGPMQVKGLEAVLKGESLGEDFDDNAPMDDIIVSIGVRFKFISSNEWPGYEGSYDERYLVEQGNSNN